MWRNILHRVLVPVLFVLVGGSVALTSTNCYIKHKQAEAEAAAAVKAAAEKAAAERAAAELERARKLKISEYDAIFKEVAKKYDLDWRLLAALAKTESSFRDDAVSRSGAVGLMQIMPAVGKSFGYTRTQLFDARTSVDLAAQVLHKNREMLQLPEDHEIVSCMVIGYPDVEYKRIAPRKEPKVKRL